MTRVSSVLVTNTHLIYVERDHVAFSIPLERIDEVHVLATESRRTVLTCRYALAAILAVGPLAIIAYAVLHIPEVVTRLFDPQFLFIGIVLFAQLPLSVLGVALLLNLLRSKKYFRFEIRAANLRRVFSLRRQCVAQHEFHRLLDDIRRSIKNRLGLHSEQHEA